MSATPSAAGAMPFPPTGGPSAPDTQSERIGVLDVLRGIALLGMFFVHFSGNSTDPGGGFGHIYRRVVQLFFSGRFFSMFAILFGVGFAVQLRRAEARGDTFIARYVRRLLTLAVFGFIAEAFFGYRVLGAYAMWGFPLLLVRRWTTKALVIALLLCATSMSIYWVTRATYTTAVGKAEQFGADRQADAERIQAINRAYEKDIHSTDYRTVTAARIRYLPFMYSQPFSLLPTNNFTLFLIGLLGLRLGLFEDPWRHRRLIAGMMIFGAASWAASEWLFPLHIAVPPAWPLPIRVLSGFATTRASAFGLLREEWLAFTYIGAILLLVARNPVWLRRLGAFGITGRMALTNYMLQIMILSFAFSNYAFGLHISAAYAPLAALALFAVDFALSRWWLSRYQFGPLEWLWRSATYARWQPMRRAATVGDS